MKLIQTSFFRALCSLVVGILLVQYRDQMLSWITIAVGALFFLSGIISIAVYLASIRNYKRALTQSNGETTADNTKPMLPFAGIGSLVLGAILAAMPSQFVDGVVYVLATILVIGAISQYVTLASASRMGRVSILYWILPTTILIIGLIALLKPELIQESALFIIGWTMIVYGIVECINGLKVLNLKRSLEKQQKALEQGEEKTPTGTNIEDEDDLQV